MDATRQSSPLEKTRLGNRFKGFKSFRLLKHPDQPPQPPPQLPQPHQQPPHPQHEELIDISSSSKDGSQPPPPKMMIPKSEEATLPTEEAQPPPSQTVVEVVNIYPTQEVIDLSSSPEEDRKQPIVPKEEQDVETSPSPRSQIISSVLVSIRREHQPIEPSSFDLGVDLPLLTPQTMEAIDEIDEQLQKNPSLLRTPDPLGTFDILADMERRVDIWGTILKGDNEFLPVFKLKGDKPLEAVRYQFKSMQPTKYVDIQVVSIMCHLLNRTPGERYQNSIYCVPPELLQRMFEKYEHRWRETKSRKPHEISTLLNIDEYLGYMEKDRLQSHKFLFAPVLCFEHWWLYVLDVEKKHLFVLDSKNVASTTPERTEMNKFVIEQHIGSTPEMGRQRIYVQERAHLFDANADLDKFREKIVANILLSPENLMRMDVVMEVNEIRLIKPAAALRSPFTQLDSADDSN
ncbi:hypothetical protein PIB30_015045 [Stylosanthes scabra]|uniref:Ubiquitin-like protease family profile domain-containing protein n=1 Tax=Stylosanthes scabra TaxID=79078 RepID=A0ABU6Z6F3_9FABA|nr:hypothetical protein [Stylosanthes scabra]